MRRVPPKAKLFAAMAILLSGPAYAQTEECQTPLPTPALDVALPGPPFAAISSNDACAIFVSLTGGGAKSPSQLAVLTRRNGSVTVASILKAEGQLTGMALSPDGHVLAAANGAGVTLFDTAKLIAGAANPLLGYLNDGSGAGSVYAAFSSDGKVLFVSDERAQGISVHDFAGVLAGHGDKIIGKIRTANGPVGLALSPDGRLLYSTSEVISGPSSICPGENGGPGHPQGELIVIDVAKAQTSPQEAVLARRSAGCNPVRVALSANGDIAYVTARGENAVEVFDTAKLVVDTGNALIAKVGVGKAPVGVAAQGQRLFVTNSDRFGRGTTQSVSVLDAGSLSSPAGQIAAGGFPRELHLTPDGNILLITNFGSRTLELVDLSRFQKQGP